ncbi:MAG: MucBP domain-containing protein [Clostridia bacterium]|nr:MucBP domain-containing protein [Clostridia bacterium]
MKAYKVFTLPIIAGGYFYGTIQVGNMTLKSKGYSDGILIKYDNTGEVEWATSYGGTSNDYIQSVAETSDGGIIAGGYFVGTTQVGDMTLTSKGNYDGILIKYEPKYKVSEQSELIVKNKLKEFKITTDVKEIDGVKGGNISGEDEKPYEKVKYGENSTKEIKMTPDENYEIISITVNGEEYPFTANGDGTYTMPQFENMTEDKHIVVTYSLKDNKIIINKVDKQTKEKLPNAIFKLDQIEERTEPVSAIGQKVDNGQDYDIKANLNDEITGVLGELTNNGTYYFAKNEDGTLVPTNSKTYQVANGGTAGIGNVTANSYVKIDLSGLEGKYKIVVNARVSSQSSYDYGYATITQTTTAPTYSNSTGRFIYISGTTSTYTTSKDYESTIALEGGKTYYLHLGYRKNASTDTGEDQIVINSIKVYGITSNTYNFIENNGKYESNNQGKANTTANSYIPIDLRNYTGKYNLTVNAQVSSQLSYDYGYATVTTTTTAPTYSNSSGRFIYISGITGTNVEPNDYTTVLDGGQMYYLHLGYYKNASTNSGLDKFTINSIKLTLNDSELYHTEVTTNSEGQAITQLPFGKYKITEITAPEGYAINDSIPDIEFRADGVHEFEIEDEKLAKITVHHYIKGTTTKVADDETETNEIGKAYTTTPKFDLEKYELEIDKDGEYVLPENAAGEFKAEDQIIIYYYVEKEIPLTVHHYIEGTNDSVPLRDGTLAQDETDSGKEGTQYTTNELSQNELNEKYELVEVAENKNGTYEGSEVIVTYYYRVKNVKVTTKVDGEGGSISGQNDSIYETVEYGENSTKEIIATPEEGYKISSITINGEEIDFTPNPDGTVKLSDFEQMKEDKEVIVSFEKIPTSVIVHHYIYDEETNTYTTIKVDEDKTITGNIDDNYTTSKTNKAQNYTCLNETPENCQGQMEKNTIEVTYYYKLNPSTLENEITKEVKASKTVEKTIEENNTEKTISVEVLTKEDEEVKYTITYKTEITDYIGKAKIVIVDTLPASIDEEKSNLKGGTYNEQNKTITWEEEVQVDTYKNGNYQYNKTKEISLVYKDQDVTKNLENKVSGKSTIYYPENYPNKEGEILESKEKTDDAIVEQEYTKEIKVTKVWDDADNIKNRRPESVTVQLTADGKNVENTSEILNKTNNWTHTYKNLPKYTESGVEINYSVKETETKAKDLEYYEDAKIEGTDNFVITNKYRLMETELESKITKQATEKITSTKDSVKYKIEYNAEVENYIGEALVTIVDTLPYKIDTQKSKLNGGVYNEDAQTITWKQTIDHINTNEDGNYEVDITKEIEVLFIDIDTLSDKIENHVKGTIDLYETEKTNTTEDDAETKIDIKGTVIAKYVDKETGKEIAQSIKVTDKVGKDYKTEQKEIDTYEFVEVKGDEEGKIKEGELEIIYYYTKIPAQVIVKHVDESGRELAKTETIEGKVGESYTTEAKEFDEYELVKEPENKNGKMAKDQITVTYVYKKVPANVIVKYLEKGTQKELAPQVEIKGYTGDGYHTERKQITNYQKATPEPENSEGKMTKETITVIYYYERIPSGTVKVKYVDIDTKEEIVDGNEIKGYVGESYETKERQLPYYTLVEEMRPQNSTGILTQKDETITYYYRKIPFNMSIEKKIKEVTHNGEKLKVQDGKIMKIELASKKIKETNIKVKYSIVVTNTEKLSGKATVIDKIPQYYKVSSENPNYWTVDNKGNLNYETKELQPGERIELEVVLEWKNGEENFGEETNIAVIESTNNAANYEETTLSDNTSSATIMMSINTGAKKATLYVIAAIGILMFTIFNINRRKQSMRRASSKSHKAYRTYKSNTHKGKHMN